MKTYVKAVLSLLAGILGFLVVGIGVTELLDPYIWPSLLVGLPVGLGAGIALVPLTYGVTYLDERHTAGAASETTVRHLWTTVAAIVGFVVGAGLATLGLSIAAIPLLSAVILGGFPVGVVTGALVAYLVYSRGSDHSTPPGTPVQ